MEEEFYPEDGAIDSSETLIITETTILRTPFLIMSPLDRIVVIALKLPQPKRSARC
jgi:hypothetical protein